MGFAPSFATGLKLTAFASAVVLSWLPAVPTHAAAFGLVIGVDDYSYLPDLKGAVNDARDVAAALEAAGFDDVRLLLDGDATRERIFSVWREIIDQSNPGDLLVLSYAGHGGQEPARIPGSEEDGLDETFLLSGFQEVRPGNGERIVDDELNLLFKDADHLKIVFVADSCHSGTMTRSFDRRTGTGQTRLGSYGPIVDDELPPPAKESALLSESELPHVTFFGAVADHQVVVELSIDGEPRGAMSWSFARAVRGNGDLDGDLWIDTAELAAYLRESVRTVTEGRQLPQIRPRGRDVSEIIRLPAETNAPISTEKKIRVFGQLAEAARLTGVSVVDSPDQADLVFDDQTKQVVSAAGDVVAQLGKTDSSLLQQMINKWRVLMSARQLAERNPLSVSVIDGDKTHHENDEIRIGFSNPRYGNIILVNLANDGTVQLIAPFAGGSGLYDGTINSARDVSLPVKIVPPFGVDHVLALVSEEPLTAMVALLEDLDGKSSDQSLELALQALNQSTGVQAGLAAIVTAGR